MCTVIPSFADWLVKEADLFRVSQSSRASDVLHLVPELL
jgi:hypothetical protein